MQATSTVAAVSATSATLDVGIQPVAATPSGDPELTSDATIPTDGAGQVTIHEYRSDDEDDKVSEQTIEIDDGENTYVADNLEGSNYYAFDVEIAADGEDAPAVSSLSLTVPPDDDDGDDADGDDDEESTDPNLFSIAGFEIELPSLGFLPFAEDGNEDDSEEDEEEDGFFSFDFWPFGGDETDDLYED